MNALTEKQRQILDVIRGQIEVRGHAPTVREIGTMVDLSSSCSVKKHLDSLETKGYIRRDRYKRDIELLDDGAPITMGRAVCVPLLGRVAGGEPLLAFENPDAEMLPVPLSLLPRGDVTSRELFALEVYGNSMVNVGIADGDIVIARKRETAVNGDIVVALIEEEATVKTYYREREAIRLQPENPEFEPIVTRDVTILGKVILAIKRFN